MALSTPFAVGAAYQRAAVHRCCPEALFTHAPLSCYAGTMHAPRLLLVMSLLSTAAMAGGCRFGQAAFSGALSGRTFDPGGTVFSYVDEHDAALVAESDPRVAVAMTWVIFDPESDLSDVEGNELADISHELVLRDALALVFVAQSVVTAGASFESVLVGGTEEGDGNMTARLHLAPDRLSGSSTYADVVPLASLRRTTVDLEVADFADLRELRGSATIAFERTDNDPGEALVGSYTGTFFAPVVEERPAEQNLSLLQSDDVIGLPLPPRSAP